ncbi:MAG: type II toxin-antitoxin system RelB/DinJ family antitoxin [Proteobacteria bacterium]|nr:type II toxin-antitoxin system RelB/DinJ family antitoxin [Pseudomonadota bacterium]
MTKTATIRARVEPDLKNKAEHVFSELGLTATEAITLFYKQVELRNAMPFDLAIPNKTTLQTFEDTDNGRNLISSEDADELFKKLSIYLRKILSRC